MFVTFQNGIMNNKLLLSSYRFYQKYFIYVTLWLSFALVATGRFGLPTAYANTAESGVHFQSIETNLAAEGSGYQVGTLVTFTFKIVNTSSLWIHVLPIDTTYDSGYLEWISSTPSPNNVSPDLLHWNDLTVTNGNVQPYRFSTISYTFKTLKTTKDLPDGVTTIRFLVSSAKAGAGEQDSSGSEVTLSDQAYSLAMGIYEPSSPAATPTHTTTAVSTSTSAPSATATPTVTKTATPSPTVTVTPSTTATSTATGTASASATVTQTESATQPATPSATATEFATVTASPSPTRQVTATQTPVPSPTQPSSATATVTTTSQQTPSPTSTTTPTDTSAPLAQPREIERSVDAVEIGWQTSDESSIVGFNLIRGVTSGVQEQVNRDLISAVHTGEIKGATYSIVDNNFSLTQDNHYVLFIQLTSSEFVTTDLGILSAVEIHIANQSVELVAQGITIQWETVDETYVTGFDLLRYDLPAAINAASEPPLTTVNESPITAIYGGEAKGATYKFVDTSSRIGGGGGYGYKLRLLLRNGETILVDLGTQPAVEIAVAVSIARSDLQGMTVHWHTTDETVITGFNILRQDKDNNEIHLNDPVIPATHSGEAIGAEYQFLDTTASSNQSYIYVVETLLIDQSSVRYIPPVEASNSPIYLPLVTR